MFKTLIKNHIQVTIKHALNIILQLYFFPSTMSVDASWMLVDH